MPNLEANKGRNMNNHTLWEQVQAFEFDKPTEEYGFSTRLSYENAWTLNFTQDALLEYKKFMFLAATATEMVSPSEIVDIVWHQHLIFTQSYSSFCDLLGKKIAHIPSTHHHAEKAKFSQAKERTKQRYEAHFGKQPDEVWKYKDELDSLRLTKFQFNLSQVNLLLGAAALILISALYYLIAPLLITIESVDFLTLYILNFAILLVFLEIIYSYHTSTILHHIYNSYPNRIFSGLHPFELVYMQTNKLTDIIHSIVNTLVKTGKVQVLKNNKMVLSEESFSDNVFENCVIEALKQHHNIYYPNLVKYLIEKPIFTQFERTNERIKKRLAALTVFLQRYALMVMTFNIWFSVGVSRLFLGIMREKPVGYLLIVLVICGIIAVFFVLRHQNYFIKTAIPNIYRERIIDKTGTYKTAEWQYFLLREATFATAFVPLAGYVDRRQDTTGGSCGSSCGSSDGGGGGGGGSCGGGCGGCGGS